jgi:hypothetical protein
MLDIQIMLLVDMQKEDLDAVCKTGEARSLLLPIKWKAAWAILTGK